MKKALIIAAVIALAFGSSAYASTITLSTAGVVGIIDFNGGTDNNNPTTRQAYANHLLGMTAGTTDPSPVPVPDTNVTVYRTSTTEYSGTVPLADTVLGTNVIPSGWQYVLAKYDGPNGGYVLISLSSWVGTTIPATAGTPYWDGGVNQEYGLSGYTLYNFVPDGGSAVMLLGAALMGLAGFRRMLK